MSPSPERKQVLIDFIIDIWAERPRRVRNWSGAGVVLCLGVAGILISVWYSGAEGADEVVVPAMIAGGLGVVTSIGLWLGLDGIKAVENHELVQALREDTSRIASVERMTVDDRYGQSLPALNFDMVEGGSHVIVMDEATREEFVDWLAT